MAKESKTDFITRHYHNVMRKNGGVVPKIFNPYNEKILKDVALTITTHCGQPTKTSSILIVEERNGKMPKQNLKTELCEKLVAENKVQEGDIVKHSYTKQIMSGKKKCVEKQDQMITLTTRGDCFGVVVKEETLFSDSEKALFTEDGNIRRYVGSKKIDKFKEGQMATTTYPNGYGHGPRTHDESIALNTIDKPCVKTNLRIRKLTPYECLKLMGFQKKDYEAMREIGMTDMMIYHCAGDSIITTVLMGIFGELLGVEDYEQRISQYTKEL